MILISSRDLIVIKWNILLTPADHSHSPTFTTTNSSGGAEKDPWAWTSTLWERSSFFVLLSNMFRVRSTIKCDALTFMCSSIALVCAMIIYDFLSSVGHTSSAILICADLYSSPSLWDVCIKHWYDVKQDYWLKRRCTFHNPWTRLSPCSSYQYILHVLPTDEERNQATSVPENLAKVRAHASLSLWHTLHLAETPESLCVMRYQWWFVLE